MATGQQQVRHEWYQTDRKVVITLFIKNAKDRNCVVDIQMERVSISGDDLPQLKFNLLHPINQAESSANTSFSTKIEVTLVKISGERWSTLEKTNENPTTPAMVTAHQSDTDLETSNASASSSGAVPKHPKDWDKLVKDIWEKEDLEKGETDALNSLFQKIYSDSNPDIQRAMNKSFTESGGTVLSTNWNEVGSGKVDVKPPDGTEYRKWEK